MSWLLSPNESRMSWVSYPTGAVFCGFGYATMLAAQGVFFAQSAELVALSSKRPREGVTSNLAANFAVITLAFEVVFKLSASGLQYFNVDNKIVVFILLAFPVLGTIGMSLAREPNKGASADQVSRTGHGSLFAVCSLWPQITLWCLSLFSFAFGFADAFNTSYVNSATKRQLGEAYIGLLLSLAALLTAVLAKLYECLAASWGKGLVVALGALSLFCIPVLVLFANLTNHGLWVGLLYLLFGSGRAVFESTARAVFAEFYPAPDTEAAFGNLTLQQAVSTALMFFLRPVMSERTMAPLVLITASLVIPGYIIAHTLKRKSLVGREICAKPEDNRGDVEMAASN